MVGWVTHGYTKESNQVTPNNSSGQTCLQSNSNQSTGMMNTNPMSKRESKSRTKSFSTQFAKGSDPLTESVAKSVVMPMLEPPDHQPSWKWIRESARTILDKARDAADEYKKTVTKAAAPLLSFSRSKMRSLSISSTLATRSSSRHSKIFIPSVKTEPDGFRDASDGYQEKTELEPSISMDNADCSYCLERYLQDKSCCRYLFSARGYCAAKQLDKIYFDDMIDKFERTFIDL